MLFQNHVIVYRKLLGLLTCNHNHNNMQHNNHNHNNKRTAYSHMCAISLSNIELVKVKSIESAASPLSVNEACSLSPKVSGVYLETFRTLAGSNSKIHLKSILVLKKKDLGLAHFQIHWRILLYVLFYH